VGKSNQITFILIDFRGSIEEVETVLFANARHYFWQGIYSGLNPVKLKKNFVRPLFKLMIQPMAKKLPCCT